MSKKLQNNKVLGVKKVAAVHSEVMSVEFSGPLPPPSVLVKYEQALPGAADRIVSMAERQAKHRQELEKNVIITSVSNESKGMWMAFLLTVGLMIFGFNLVINDKDGALAYLAIFGPVVFHAGNYIYNKRQEEKKVSESQ